MSGAGNDFIIIDDRKGALSAVEPSLARALCSRHQGIGADGLLIVRQSLQAMFMMKYYNADGSFGGMCGNGGRCIARYAFLKGLAPTSMTFEALDYVYSAQVDGVSVHLTMKNVNSKCRQQKIQSASSTIEGWLVDSGSPHFVTFVDCLDDVDVFNQGRFLRSHSSVGADGANINFVQRLGQDTIGMRTYERGVEDETLACGTGAVASALAFAIRSGTGSPVSVAVQSGEKLTVSFSKSDGIFTNVRLSGSAHVLFTGRVSIDHSRCSLSL